MIESEKNCKQDMLICTHYTHWKKPMANMQCTIQASQTQHLINETHLKVHKCAWCVCVCVCMVCVHVCLSAYMHIMQKLRTHLMHSARHPVPAETDCCWNWIDMTVWSWCHTPLGPPSSGVAQWKNWMTLCTSPLWWATSARQYSDWCYHNKLRHLPMVKHSE